MIARVVLTLAGLVLVGGSLAGCSHGAPASQVAPAAGITASTASPSPATSGNDSSLQDVQNDLNAADSATANASGDVAGADSAAATSDSP